MKKILAVILVVMLAAALVVPMSAAGTLTFYLEADNDTVNAGDVVTVSLAIKNNPGLAGASVAISYDPAAFEVVDEDVDIEGTGKIGLVGAQVDSPEFAKAPYNCPNNVGFVFGQAKNYTRNAALGIVYFTAKDDAVSGDYEFGIAVMQTKNADKQDVPYEIDDPITVTVNGSAAPQPQDEVHVGVSASTGDVDTVSANFYVTVPATEDVTTYTVSVDNAAPVALGADGKFEVSKSAKAMGDAITYTVYDKDGKAFGPYTTSVKAYCEAITSGDSYSAEVKAVASAMLAYGAAAQKFFNYHVDDLVTNAKVETPVADVRFDYTALRAALKAAGAPIDYTSMNCSFDSETTLMLAFQVKEGEASAALAWFDTYVEVVGATSTSIMSSGANRFVVVKIAGITVDGINAAHNINVNGNKVAEVSVANYLAAVEYSKKSNGADAASAAMKDLARALYAYATAVDALA